nr:MAG TPA: hypothetical protein [Caudoviricetes sp.]
MFGVVSLTMGNSRRLFGNLKENAVNGAQIWLANTIIRRICRMMYSDVMRIAGVPWNMIQAVESAKMCIQKGGQQAQRMLR